MIPHTDKLCPSRCSSLDEKNEHSTSSTPSLRRQTLLSLAQHKQACESSDGGRKKIELDFSADKEKGDQRDDKKKEADDEEEEPDGDSIKNNTPLPRSPPQKRCLPAAENKPPSKHLTKRRHFSLPLSSDEETEIRDESDTTSYAPCKSHHILNLEPTSFHSTGPDGGTSDYDALDFTGGKLNRRLPSRTAVVYEQQSWEGEIIEERDVKQGRGRPRKEYLVRWKRSWMPGGRLTAPGLVESWKTKASRRRC